MNYSLIVKTIASFALFSSATVGNASPNRCFDRAAIDAATAAARGGSALLDSSLLADALASLEAHGCAKVGRAAPRTIVIVDFGRKSSIPRAYIVDLMTGAGQTKGYLVAHGKGSDANHDGFADRFSDVPDSKTSSLGAFRGAEKYEGKHGLSVRLDGLDESNRRARARAIVIHAQGYVSTAFVRTNKILGRSFGCFVFSATDLETFVTAMRDGGFLYAGLSTKAHLRN